MTDGTLKRLAREAGMRPYQEQAPGIDGAVGDWGDLARFAALVRADERERWIAKAGAAYTEAHALFNDPPSETPQDVRDVIEWHLYRMRHDEIETDAAAIRALKDAP